jgi:hypothetical protein
MQNVIRVAKRTQPTANQNFESHVDCLEQIVTELTAYVVMFQHFEWPKAELLMSNCCKELNTMIVHKKNNSKSAL